MLASDYGHHVFVLAHLTFNNILSCESQARVHYIVDSSIDVDSWQHIILYAVIRESRYMFSNLVFLFSL